MEQKLQSVTNTLAQKSKFNGFQKSFKTYGFFIQKFF